MQLAFNGYKGTDMRIEFVLVLYFCILSLFFLFFFGDYCLAFP
jgi:hypothetical protein